MRSNLLFFGPSSEQDQLPAASPSMVGAAGRDLQQMLEDADYEVSKRLKQQSRAILNQRSDLDRLRSLSSQLQDTTSGLPTQVAELSTRATAAEARAGELIGEASTAKQKAETVERQLTAKIGDVENRAARVSDQVGRVEDQTSALATRTEALEKELDRRAREVEARTEELGERTAGLKEREEQFDRLHRVALAAIMANLTADVGEFDRRTQSAFYRYVNKGDAQRDAESLRQRITQLKSLLSEAPTDEVKQHAQQVDELGKRLDQIASRLK
jgi:chromosome segregation ATPase